jgi:hypothetical protein
MDPNSDDDNDYELELHADDDGQVEGEMHLLPASFAEYYLKPVHVRLIHKAADESPDTAPDCCALLVCAKCIESITPCQVVSNGYSEARWCYTMEGPRRLYYRKYRCTAHELSFNVYTAEAMQHVDWQQVTHSTLVIKRHRTFITGDLLWMLYTLFRRRTTIAAIVDTIQEQWRVLFLSSVAKYNVWAEHNSEEPLIADARLQHQGCSRRFTCRRTLLELLVDVYVNYHQATVKQSLKQLVIKYSYGISLDETFRVSKRIKVAVRADDGKVKYHKVGSCMLTVVSLQTLQCVGVMSMPDKSAASKSSFLEAALHAQVAAGADGVVTRYISTDNADADVSMVSGAYTNVKNCYHSTRMPATLPAVGDDRWHSIKRVTDEMNKRQAFAGDIIEELRLAYAAVYDDVATTQAAFKQSVNAWVQKWQACLTAKAKNAARVVCDKVRYLFSWRRHTGQLASFGTNGNERVHRYINSVMHNVSSVRPDHMLPMLELQMYGFNCSTLPQVRECAWFKSLSDVQQAAYEALFPTLEYFDAVDSLSKCPHIMVPSAIRKVYTIEQYKQEWECATDL